MEGEGWGRRLTTSGETSGEMAHGSNVNQIEGSRRDANRLMDYYTGYSTGFSAGWVAHRDRASAPASCTIFTLASQKGLKRRIRKGDIYAVNEWTHWRATTHPFHVDDAAKANYIVALYDDAARAMRVAREHRIPLHRMVLLDFSPGCRPLPSDQIHRVRLETIGCRARQGYDILSPHSASVPARAFQKLRRRSSLIFFHGHLSKPYIDYPRSTLRYVLWKALRDEPGCDVGAYDVETSVNELTTHDPARLCKECSYTCKTCYFGAQDGRWPNSPRLSNAEFIQRMQRSVFCIAARGDNPGSPKLAEAIVSGCIPIIIVDQPLPFERVLNYTAFSLRLPLEEVLADPALVLRVVKGVNEDSLATMQRNLRHASSFFDFHDNPFRFSAQDAIIDEICALP